MKGAALFKRKKARYWSQILRDWWNSPHPVLIIHCLDHDQAKRAKIGAYRFKETLEPEVEKAFTCAIYGNDLFITRIVDPQYAMEVVQTEKGVLYYYDTSSSL